MQNQHHKYSEEDLLQTKRVLHYSKTITQF